MTLDSSWSKIFFQESLNYFFTLLDLYSYTLESNLCNVFCREVNASKVILHTFELAGNAHCLFTCTTRLPALIISPGMGVWNQ